MNRTLLVSGMLLATAPAFAQHSTSTHARSAQTQSAKKPFSQATTIAGRVTLADGKPAGNALVYLSWTTDNGETRVRQIGVDDRGAFGISIKLTPKPIGNAVLLTAGLPAQGIVTHQVGLADKALGKLALKIQPSTSLTGQIIRSDGSPVANTVVALESLMPSPMATMQVAQQQPTIVLPLPGQALTLFHTQTDATGRFTLTGLPANSQVGLKLGKGLLLSSGSMNAISLRSTKSQDTGLLVAVQPGRIKLHLTDRQTNKPAVGIGSQLASTIGMPPMASDVPINDIENESLAVDTLNLNNGVFTANSGALETAPGFINSFAQSDAHGDLEFANLRPGDYHIFVQGRVISAHVEEGQTVPPIRLALRQGALQGRLLDPQGKPLFHVAIQVLNGTPHRLVGRNQNGDGQVNGDSSNNGVKSSSDGSFTLSTVPWGSAAVTIRAIHGNDLAEWTGSPDKLGQNLVLKMQSNALVTITGRLIDPQRHPVSKLKFQTLHWLDSPRSTWFATAHQATLDAQGNFKITGLERGESFSLVTTAAEERQIELSENVAPQASTESAHGSVKNVRVTSFESPRFTTPKIGQEQNLGEMMIHPEQDPGDIIQIYGDQDPIEQARLNGFLRSPSEADAQAARQALAQYQTALKTRDLETLHQLASTLSPGWSSNRATFLQQCSLMPYSETDPTGSDRVRALPLVSRSVAAGLLRFSAVSQGMTGGANVDAIIRELDRNPNLVFLAEQRTNGVALAGILRKEEGVWHVVALPNINTPLDMTNAQTSAQAGSASSSGFTQLASLSVDSLTEARQTAERYLQAWAQNQVPGIQELSPVSPLYTTKSEEFKQRWAARQDEGICPLTAADTIELQPLENLTIWDHRQLTDLIFQGVSRGSFVAVRGSFEGVVRDDNSIPQAPATIARHGDTTFFRYTSEGQSYIIALLRYDGKWTVLEPALPM